MVFEAPQKWTYNTDDVRAPYKSAERLKTPVYYKGKNGERKEWLLFKGALRGDIWEYPTLAGKLYKQERTEHLQKPESLFTDRFVLFAPRTQMASTRGSYSILSTGLERQACAVRS